MKPLSHNPWESNATQATQAYVEIVANETVFTPVHGNQIQNKLHRHMLKSYIANETSFTPVHGNRTQNRLHRHMLKQCIA